MSFTSAMQAASQARQVPLPLIEATAYVDTRWEWINTPAIDGGIGPMKILPSQLAQASLLSGHTASQIDGDLQANLDAGAALLAADHTGGTDLASWRGAVVATQGQFVAGEIYDALGTGATRTTSTGETITLDPQPVAPASPTSPGGANVAGGAAGATGAAASTSSPDYPPATWVPADPSNYSYANRPHDYPIDMIVIHDIEGSSGSAIQLFQTPNYGGSAHYVVSYSGQVTQMVREQDIAWHAGNWDYNTRAIGIEHAGYASQNLYTQAEYNASAALAASICSRYGVVLDRTHVIGHYQVPDPNNPGLYGGVDHHTDPGPYWNWTGYMAIAVNDSMNLPSPPVMMPDPVATNDVTSATVTWGAARTCRPAQYPITGYTVTTTPATTTMTLPATARTATFTGLTPETKYTFTVTAINSQGSDSKTSNGVWPGRCNNVRLTPAPGSPQASGTTVTFSATSSGCANPSYAFGELAPGSNTWTTAQAYGTASSFAWNTAGHPAGTYSFLVVAKDAGSPGTFPSTFGTYDDTASLDYTVNPAPCQSVTATASPGSPSVSGTSVTITGSAAGCPSPSYQFWQLAPGSKTWQMVRDYSATPTFAWNTAGQLAGAYQFSVWARDASSAGAHSTGLGTYDTFAGIPYTLNPAACTSVTATPAPPSPSLSGTQITLTGAGSGCPSPLYEFWAKWQGSTSWQLLRGYSSTASYTWNSTGALPGTETFGVWVRDASSTAAYDTYTGTPYTITSPSCGSVTASASPPSPSQHGTGVQVTITGAAAGCTNANPQYEFWMMPAGTSTWRLLQGYTPSPTYTWNTNGAPAGTDHFGVWVRDANSHAPYDSYIAVDYTLT